jgi:eukaryotic-like serine/threonine-protein kinase
MDALAQLTSALSGRYAIDREIGRGGMATVYLARDIRHARNVALKVLNPELGAILGVERFLAEIRVTANLQHPNLLPLFDSGEAEGLLFYVMPYVEGESLRSKLIRERQLVVHEALHIGVGVASALDYAHRHNVVHRDLKPENILLHEGQPMIADFGIALAVSNAGGARITQTGLSLGTPQYMSPEQATGDRTVDGRSDIYSLGAVLYESLAGEPPYMGGTVQAIIAKVLTEPVPSVKVRRPAVPDHVAAAISCALEKLPADRWPNAQDFAIALQGRSVSVPVGAVTPSTIARAAEPRRAGRPVMSSRVTRGAAIGASLAAVSIAAWLGGRAMAAPANRTVRLAIALPPDRAVTAVLAGPGLTISPDGSRIAYSGGSRSGTQLYVRDLNELMPRPIAGTSGGLYPFFAADGNSLLFYSSRGLRHVSIQGGPSTVVTVGQYIGAAGAPDGRIVIGGGSLKGLGVVAQTGGETRIITHLDSARGETQHLWPRVLRDGKTVLFSRMARGALAESKIGIVDIDGGGEATLDLPGSSPLGTIDDHIIYVRSDGMLMAAAVDLGGRKVRGLPIPLGVSVALRGNGTADAALSQSGDLVYMTGSLDTQGFIVSLTGAPRLMLGDLQPYSNPRFSPDGRRIAMTVTNMSATDIWTYDLASKTLTRLTTESGTNDRAEWTSDGKRVLFRTQRAGGYQLWSQPAEGGEAQLVYAMPTGSVQEASMSRDGKAIALRVETGPSGRDVVVLPTTPDAKPIPISATSFDELMPRFSPDGKWIAYVSDESGQYEVYVKPYPAGSSRHQVSVEGGFEPVWSPDMRRLYYRHGQTMMAASLAAGTAFGVSSRAALFDGAYATSPFHQNYDIAPSGREFVMFQAKDVGRQIYVVLNWAAEVRQKIRAR